MEFIKTEIANTKLSTFVLDLGAGSGMFSIGLTQALKVNVVALGVVATV